MEKLPQHMMSPQIFSIFAKMEKFCPNMEYRNKFFLFSEDGKFLAQYGIILIGMSFQTLHAYTSWFGPNWLLKSRTSFSSQFFSLLKNLPQYGITDVDAESKFLLLSPLPWIKTATQVFEPLFLQNFSKSLWKICPSVLSSLIMRHSLDASWLFPFSQYWRHALGH